MNIIFKNKFAAFSIMLISSLLFIGTSCSDEDNADSSSYSWKIASNSIVNIKPERYKLLRNPLQGWNIYTGIGNGLVDDFWERYDNFESSQGRVKVSDYGTTLYIRGAWSDFNPVEGVYIWQDGVDTKPAKRFRMLVEGAKKRNLRLGFTFIVDSRDKHYNFTPDYVKAAGAKGYTTTTGSVQVWSPYPDDPVFQAKYSQFMRDFAAKYNDPDVTAYISGFGLGKWGETHSLIYSTGDEKPKEAVFNWITDLMSGLFTKVPIFINYHRCILATKSFSGTDLSAAADLISRAIDKGFCIRHDAFGMKSYYTTWERGIANRYFRMRPIIGEGGWVQASHGSSITSDGYANYTEVRKGEFDEAKASHVNMMDFRYATGITSGETHSWFTAAFDLVKEFIAEGGYRLYPDKISIPASAASGSTIQITHRWSNLGWGYCPNNIPQWNYKYKVAFALLDKATEKPVYTFVDETPKISDWLRGSPSTYTFKFSLSDVMPNNYIWAVGIVDTSKSNSTIGLYVSARDEYLTSDGWVKLIDVSVK